MTSLETLHEIAQRIEAKVDKTNGTVARLEEWRIRHEEQQKALMLRIEGNEKRLSILRPIETALQYPRTLFMATVGFYLFAISDIRKPIIQTLLSLF